MRRDTERQLEDDARRGAVRVRVNLGWLGKWIAGLFDRRRAYKPRTFAAPDPERRKA